MNKFILSEDQILGLKNFIHKRGKESDVVHEILDHFVCKIEELMNKDIYLPFDRAMQLAHQSFGKSGFRPLVASYEKEVNQIMWKIFKKELKNTLLSPKILFLITFSLLLFSVFKLTRQIPFDNWFLDFNIVGLLLIIFISSLSYFIVFRKIKEATRINWWGKRVMQNYWQIQVISIPRLPLLPVLIGCLIGSDLSRINYSAYAVLVAILTTFSLIRVSAQHKTYLEMESRFAKQS